MYLLSTSAETASASKYLQQLCKHFAHKVPANWTPETGTVDFPFGSCRMEARDGMLTILCETPSRENLPRLKGVIDDHLERFAWREQLKLTWQESLQPQASAPVRQRIPRS
ncbi:2,4-dihydroxyhept-2-ene-1, 7-dioic acid aldolase, hypothetical [Polymorphum gilvum SL003B-26A1]|uniref:2,4-dihydroxyhept-2-ene-1, 7-dioic acid aldolase, hypothetical n=2 Tax=Polymorphum TaxID=991903 RepID=F2IYX3_POLGS|nr:2,4-dihydroxyhept-2-ene-1, 7-dioic acid aldolase, hypothetical [Polymorphum gilvum SL003B-26A1]